jgi:5-methylcytosine-specific restriction endonuclease McrA
VCNGDDADTIDHLTPVSKGGSHDDANLAAIHRTPCHDDKTEQERRAGVAARSRKPTSEHTPTPEPHRLDRAVAAQ